MRILPAPTAQVAPGIQRWDTPEAAIVADFVTANPGVHVYPKRPDQRLLIDPMAAGLAVVAAQHALLAPDDDAPVLIDRAELEVLIDAAEKWASELGTYVMPAAGEGDAAGYQSEEQAITTVIDRFRAVSRRSTEGA